MFYRDCQPTCALIFGITNRPADITSLSQTLVDVTDSSSMRQPLWSGCCRKWQSWHAGAPVCPVEGRHPPSAAASPSRAGRCAASTCCRKATQLHLSIVNSIDQWRAVNISPACTAAAQRSCISRALAKMHSVRRLPEFRPGTLLNVLRVM